MASLEHIKLRMKDTPITQGWGALLALSHAAVNTVLQQTVLQGERNERRMPPLRVVADEGEHAVHRFAATGIVFGTPQLSFKGATLADARVAVTLPIIAGHYVATYQPLGAPATISSSGIISEAHGRNVSLSAQLKVTKGYVDGQARVILDLAEAANVQTNLAGEDEATNRALAGLVKEQFDRADNEARFMLAKFNCVDYTDLSPAECEVRTMESDNPEFEGDGAVLVLMQLHSELPKGSAVTELPYLIPDDTAVDGTALYTATLVVAQALAGEAESIPDNLTDNMVFPNTHVLWGGSIERPHDLAHFGNLVPAMDTYTVRPANTTIIAGGTQQFTLHTWQGDPIQAGSWSVAAHESHTPASHGSISPTGLYTAPTAQEIGHDSLQLVVTATGNRLGVDYLVHAKAVVTHEARTVTPQLAVQHTDTPIRFSAAADMAWHLTGPVRGTLQGSGNQAQFTFEDKTTYPALVVQKLEARSGTDTRQAAALRCNGQPLYAIGPPHATLVKKGSSTDLAHDATFLSAATRRWTVLNGSGTVDQQGGFTAPDDGLPTSNLVQCELVHNGVVFCSGYSVLDMSERNDEPTWPTVENFYIKVAGSNDESQGTLVANGYQQLHVTVYVKTAELDIDGEKHKIPLSSNERLSMRLARAGNWVPPVFEDYEGIDPTRENADQDWRTRKTKNFLYKGSAAGHPDNSQPLAENNETTLDFYLHSRAGRSTSNEFKGTFIKDPPANTTINSDDKDSAFQHINVAAETPPTFSSIDYWWPKNPLAGGDPNFPDRPVRVWTGDLPTLAAPNVGGLHAGEDPNDYHFNTIDYWAVNINKTYHPEHRQFLIAQLISDSIEEPIHLSMLEWESEAYGEMMASFTGLIFYNLGRVKPPSDKLKEKFDGALKVIAPGLDLNTYYSESHVHSGDLIITLHRRDNLEYRYADRDDPIVVAALAKIRNSLIKLRVVDNFGDLHYFKFGFPNRGFVDHRNTVIITFGSD